MIELSVTSSEKKVLIDDGDFSLLYWCTFYPNGRQIFANGISVATRIMGKAPEGLEWDHADRNIYNNQRSNLRLATRSQNQANQGKRSGSYTSVYKGVCWDLSKKKWVAQITIDRKTKKLGRFTSEEDAARAYDAAALEAWGDFSVLNFP